MLVLFAFLPLVAGQSRANPAAISGQGYSQPVLSAGMGQRTWPVNNVPAMVQPYSNQMGQRTWPVNNVPAMVQPYSNQGPLASNLILTNPKLVSEDGTHFLTSNTISTSIPTTFPETNRPISTSTIGKRRTGKKQLTKRLKVAKSTPPTSALPAIPSVPPTAEPAKPQGTESTKPTKPVAPSEETSPQGPSPASPADSSAADIMTKALERMVQAEVQMKILQAQQQRPGDLLPRQVSAKIEVQLTFSDPECGNGKLSVDGTACCARKCSVCASTNSKVACPLLSCCGKTIAASQRYCDETEAPCVMGSAPEEKLVDDVGKSQEQNSVEESSSSSADDSFEASSLEGSKDESVALVYPTALRPQTTSGTLGCGSFRNCGLCLTAECEWDKSAQMCVGERECRGTAECVFWPQDCSRSVSVFKAPP